MISVEDTDDHSCKLEDFNDEHEHEEDIGPVYKSHEELMTKVFKGSCDKQSIVAFKHTSQTTRVSCIKLNLTALGIDREM